MYNIAVNRCLSQLICRNKDRAQDGSTDDDDRERKQRRTAIAPPIAANRSLKSPAAWKPCSWPCRTAGWTEVTLVRAPSQDRSRSARSISRRFRATSPAWSRKAAGRSPPTSSRARTARSSDEPADEIADVVKTLGQVAEYWLSDPQRAVEVQTGLGKAYLDLWASAAKRLAGEAGAAGRRARPARQTLRRPRMVVEPVLRLPQAGLSAHHAMGRPAGQGRRGPRPAHPAEGRILRAADRQRDLAVEFRADQSGSAARDAVVERRKPRARHAHAGRGHRGRRRQPEDPPVRLRRSSRSAATSRSRPAR